MALSQDTVKRNQQAGAYLKEARLNVGLTQADLAILLGLKHYTLITQLEKGAVTVPVGLWIPLAEALKLNTKMFALLMLRWTKSDVYLALFGTETPEAILKRLES